MVIPDVSTLDQTAQDYTRQLDANYSALSAELERDRGVHEQYISNLLKVFPDRAFESDEVYHAKAGSGDLIAISLGTIDVDTIDEATMDQMVEGALPAMKAFMLYGGLDPEQLTDDQRQHIVESHMELTLKEEKYTDYCGAIGVLTEIDLIREDKGTKNIAVYSVKPGVVSLGTSNGNMDSIHIRPTPFSATTPTQKLIDALGTYKAQVYRIQSPCVAMPVRAMVSAGMAHSLGMIDESEHSLFTSD